jgi:hypothetical protein
MKPLKAAVLALGMDRRELLTRFGAVLGTASLGGCLGRYRDAVGGVGETTTDSTTQGTTTTQTTAQPPTLADTSFELLDGGCGQPTSDASVAFAEAENGVTVTGTVSGSNTCYTAKLVDASYDPETGTLDLTVASMQKEDAGACGQCIVEIEYEATATFEGGLPDSVRVVHEAMGETKTVATAESE